MLTHSTRRWLAGLGVAGAFVTASATPASAENSDVDLGVYFADMTIAVGSEGKAGSPTLYASEPVVLHGVSVRYDYRALAGKVTLEPEAGSGECTTPEQGVLLCTDPFEIGLDDWGLGGLFNVLIAPTASATDGDAGELKVTLAAEGATAVSQTAKVRIGEGVDLAGGPEVERSAAPGGTFTAPLVLSNSGTTTAKGAVVIFDHDPSIKPGKKFNNCTYEGDELRTCRFADLTVDAGETWSAEVPYTLGKDAYAPGKDYGYHTWMTVAEFEDFAAYLDNLGVSIGEPGTDAPLTLAKAPANVRGFQADTNPDNNWSGMEVTVTGKNGADLAAIGDTVTGRAGAVVTATVGFRNNGPASLYFGRSGNAVTKVDVIVPTGTTAVEVPEVCAPLHGQEQDWTEAGQPGAPVYRCWPDFAIAVDEEQTVEFGLRIDKVVSNAKGTVTINAKCECDGFTEDTKPANDTAALLVNAASGAGQGGGDGGTLPITGTATGLIAGLGGLLLVAGLGGYAVARRRRTRFVA